ncbi:HD domain-containing protein [Gloeobacter morelensis]|uniref:HD domain-containing protein n=1 Tax=Gloeobacter morelensis MG652769 TaxID=2781736 RepID=A0ABY3PJH5_9CYAN|nr:HD domain-containing protein [Gloeobacter morelensis]UFP93802.1 HD domain-containing protein [Gloeobacter morelensis MG652769]
MSIYSVRYNDALILAARAHRDQLRKGTDIPYVMHPFHVSLLLIRCGYSEDVAIAALLHDVVEDCNVSLEAIETAFGPQVARLVEAVSEIKLRNGEKIAWEERKRLAIGHLCIAGPEVAALKAADTLHNVQSMIHELRTHGPGVWAHFGRGPQPTFRYYREVLSAVRLWLDSDHPLFVALEQAVQAVENLSREGGEGFLSVKVDALSDLPP